MARSLLHRSCLSGMIAGFTTAATLMMLAIGKKIPVWRAFNCTAHWVDGPAAAEVDDCDIRHTAIGQGTNVIACIFWAALMEAALGARALCPLRACIAAATTAIIAVPADYIATPKRFTPGWEFVFRKREIAVIYAGMAVGLAIGALVARRETERA